MWREIEPYERHEITVEGGTVVAYVFGAGDETVLCLNGGPERVVSEGERAIRSAMNGLTCDGSLATI